MNFLKKSLIVMIILILTNLNINFILYTIYDYFFPKKADPNFIYIQYECSTDDLCGGWADRIKGVMSSYAISLLTDRRFLIKMTKNCDLKNILEPNEINWDYEQVPKNITLKSKEIEIGWDFDYYDIFKKDISLFTKLDYINIIKTKAGIMFANSFNQNVNLKNKTEQLGYKQSEFHIAYQFHKWYKKMFKLNSKIQMRYDNFLKRLKPNRDSKLICCQIRKGDPNQREQRDEFVEQNFWNFINQTFLISNNYSSNFKIFVTSDLEYVKLDAKDYFKNNEVIFNENSSLHIDQVLMSDNECEKMENVLLDFHLMQNCDIGVVSHSGYGILSLWNRPDPFKDLYVYSKEFDYLDLKNAEDRNKFFSNFKNLKFIKYSKLGDIFFQ
ncbi:unnamed protein product [Brachionus calyciflorus]|uniref:Uncharacterized protein n=1 Tax=Brachionus calyciflorus TaxID=104777 RepID=A0A813PC69_9BILA|nr:unnamed protein product [Brachionus calyciflorus]